MLERLVVKNVALMDEAEVEFHDGLNILTGETGAGKSILIDSINLALGAKADKGLIRQGAEYAYVELVFDAKSENTARRLKELEIFPDEEGKVVLTRRIMPGKSSCRINGETVSGKVLKEAAGVLIDIHGQHEHQSLLSEKKHLEVLDLYAAQKLDEIKDELSKVYITYKEAEKELLEALEEDASKDRDIALAQFEKKEIEEANLQEGEDEKLEAEFRRMENVRVIGEYITMAGHCLDNYENESAQSLIGHALKGINDAGAFDEALKEPAEQLAAAEELVRDVSRFLSRYAETLEIDTQSYAYTKERLDTINRLKTKYGNSIAEILTYAEEKTKFLHKFEDFEQYKMELAAKKEQLRKALLTLCAKAHEERRRQAAQLQKLMQDALLELNFPYARFEIEVTEDEKYLSKTGDDYVRFLISLNAGEALKPLTQVASGGELSRIMLALKTVLADQDEIESLIFDEIDAGISGKTAWKVSEKLGLIAKSHQVICITHLAQIAAMADHHYMIEKQQTDGHTKTTLTMLDEDGMIGELSRLLGGDIITDATLTNARELKEMAIHAKQY